MWAWVLQDGVNSLPGFGVFFQLVQNFIRFTQIISSTIVKAVDDLKSKSLDSDTCQENRFLCEFSTFILVSHIRTWKGAWTFFDRFSFMTRNHLYWCHIRKIVCFERTFDFYFNFLQALQHIFESLDFQFQKMLWKPVEN